jgi:uncharacterized protein with NRDE domain
MCLIFLSLHHHQNYKLIIAANRDEFYQRQTAPADFWTDHPTIVGGRDLEASGTWMAMNKNRRISMVTNYRDLNNLKQQAPSRGALVSEYLIGNDSPETYLKNIQPRAADYNGFNLLVGNSHELYYLSNYREGVHRLEHGIYGLSNALLDTPWPKVARGKQNFEQVLKAAVVDPHALFDLLRDEERAPDEKLPDTGIGLERERMLSSMFIKSPNYGTRCSTVLLIDKQDRVTYTERVYNLQTFEYNTRTFTF